MILFRPSLIVYYRMGCIWAPPSKTFQTLRLLLSASWAISLLCFLQSSMWLLWLCPEVMWELYRTSVPFSAASACPVVSCSPLPHWLSLWMSTLHIFVCMFGARTNVLNMCLMPCRTSIYSLAFLFSQLHAFTLQSMLASNTSPLLELQVCTTTLHFISWPFPDIGCWHRYSLDPWRVEIWSNQLDSERQMLSELSDKMLPCSHTYWYLSFLVSCGSRCLPFCLRKLRSEMLKKCGSKQQLQTLSKC